MCCSRLQQTDTELGTESSSGQLDRTSELPLEIMTAILTQVWDGSVVLAPNPAEYFWSLGRVCSRWRKIVWSSTSICIFFWYTSYHKRKNEARTIRESLTHIISNTTASLTINSIRGEVDPFIDIILSHADRLSKLYFSIVSQKTYLSILNLPPYSFEVLEQLQMHIPVIDDISLLPNISSLETAPNLRRVTYTTNHNIRNPPYVSQALLLPFQIITQVVVHSMPIPLNGIQRILISSPCLTRCYLVTGTNQTALIQQQTTLFSLKVLHLSTTPNTHTLDWSDLLTLFITPALENLAIDGPQSPLQAAASFITRTSCPLKYLWLGLGYVEVVSNGPDVDFLTERLPPSLVSLTMPWIVKGSIFRKVKCGLFPALKKINLCVGPEGLEAFFDLIDSYGDGMVSEKRCFDAASIGLWVEPELKEHYERLVKSHREIEGSHISVQAFR